MKVREIILDFTSLLDVIMIILFWFIINSRQEMQTTIQTAQQNAAQAVSEAQQAATEAVSEAEQKMQDAENLQLKVEQELAAMDSDAQQSNAQAVYTFGQGLSIVASLEMEPEGWKLKVLQGDTILGTITDREPQKIGLKFNQILADAGYAPDDTVLCILKLDFTQPDTRTAYAQITEAFRQMQLGNKRFYYTEIDISQPEEE